MGMSVQHWVIGFCGLLIKSPEGAKCSDQPSLIWTLEGKTSQRVRRVLVGQMFRGDLSSSGSYFTAHIPFRFLNLGLSGILWNLVFVGLVSSKCWFLIWAQTVERMSSSGKANRCSNHERKVEQYNQLLEDRSSGTQWKNGDERDST